MTSDDFASSSSRLSNLHFSAAKTLIPKLEASTNASYTFVTGDGGGHISGKRSALGELNSYHIWGLSAAMRLELALTNPNIACREVRVGLPVNRSEEERLKEPRDRPLSEDIGDLCAGLAANSSLSLDGDGSGNGDYVHGVGQEKGLSMCLCFWCWCGWCWLW